MEPHRLNRENMGPMAEMKTININCFRYDPSADRKPRYQNYKIPFMAGVTAHDMLEYIYENLDSSLAFFSSCRRGICGRCMIRVDGKSYLACEVEITGDAQIDPLHPDRVIRDLKVDSI